MYNKKMKAGDGVKCNKYTKMCVKCSKKKQKTKNKNYFKHLNKKYSQQHAYTYIPSRRPPGPKDQLINITNMRMHI